MLRACRRVLKPGGRIGYYNIFVSDELDEDERRRIGNEAPSGVYSRHGQRALLRTAGFSQITEQDVTEEFLRISLALYEANERHAKGVRRAVGAKAFREAQEGRWRTVERIERGEVKRSLLLARRSSKKR